MYPFSLEATDQSVTRIFRIGTTVQLSARHSSPWQKKKKIRPAIKQLLDEVEHDIMNYQTEVCVIRHEVLIIHDIMRKPNSIIVLLHIFKQ